MTTNIAIIGGGAAGFFAAINGARNFPNHSFRLFEAGQRFLTKVLISGGGRCNVTHNCFDPAQLARNYPRGSKELIGAFHRFGPADTCRWFAAEGVTLVAEADGRMFPSTNKSQTIAGTLTAAAERAGVRLSKGCKITAISKEDSGFVLTTGAGETLVFDKLLLATGSAPQGFAFAEALGHTIVSPVPSLFTFTIRDEFLTDLPGQSMEQVAAELHFAPELGFESYKMKGPLLVTHWGLSGPAVLKLSAFAARSLAASKYQARLKISWLPHLNQEQCFQELDAYRRAHPQKSLAYGPFPQFSKRLWQQFIHFYTGKTISEQWNSLDGKTLRTLSAKLCSHEFSVSAKGVFKEEFVTAGGVSRSEINFATMESKIVPGLYFAGEIIDIDGITGGFNFQNAWTTAWIASSNFG